MATYPEPFAPRNPFQGMSVPDYGSGDVWSPNKPVDNDPWGGGSFEVPNSSFQPVQQPASKVAAADPTASVTRYGGGNQNVDLRGLDSYRDIRPNPMGPGAMNLADPSTLPPGSKGIYGSGPDTPSQITRNPSRSSGGSYGSNSMSSYQQQVQPRAPLQAMKTPELPKYEGIGEYKPPEEDPNAYKIARREAMGPGMRELREGTREAISSGQSLDNPNARSKFIQDALKGYGKGLENVAAGAAKEGRAEAGRKRSEQLSLYKTNYDVRSNVYLTNYQNKVNKIAQDFAAEQSVRIANWSAGIDQGAGASSLQYLNSSRPSAGYTGTNGSVRMY